MRTFTTGALCSLSLAVSLSLPASAWSQEKVGVATTVIGPVTGQAVRDAGLTVAVEAETYTIEGLVSALVAHVQRDLAKE